MSPHPASSSSPSSSAASDRAFPRAVEHALGTTEIPERPERVVVLDTGELDAALALDVTPDGAVTTDVSSGFLSYLAEGAADVERVGTISEPNLEAIAALRPDLILSNKVRHGELYDELSAIAPTVFAEQVGAVRKEHLLLAAEALGLEEDAAAALAEYGAGGVQGGRRGPRAAPGRPGADGEPAALRVGDRARLHAGVVHRHGAGRRRAVPAGPATGEVPQFAAISLEQLTLADADVVLYSAYGDVEESRQESVVGGPLWPRLTAVQDGRAYAVEDDVFFTGIG